MASLSLIFLLSTLMALVHANTPLPEKIPCGISFPASKDRLSIWEGLVNGTITDRQKGSADLFGQNGGPKPWPRNSRNKVVIKYCYEFQSTKQKLENALEMEGFSVWRQALGGGPSASSHYGVEFSETKDSNGNDAVPKDALAIIVDYTPGASGSATIGYVYDNANPEVCIHINDREHRLPQAIAHELGHVLGMAHEHQRPDRDYWLKYRCHMLWDFKKKIDELRRYIPEPTYADLCDDVWHAWQVNFSGKDYVKGESLGDARTNPDFTPKKWNVRQSSMYYDKDSIMQYPSWLNAEPVCTRVSMDYCPLVENNGGQSGWVEDDYVPSGRDVEWVKGNYPWKDPA
ncbi:hypothetical protein CC80DRAFT_594118 [Byssothecium circinans]|uniref:Peptidase metallopeptidase domain-containing protein n=1 Tax=Byssothecium circinans TaxID=147558 RepID=A0A6A5TU53_9PLEO|nr:hypothetical protein CC80DRAFT_594118 [Byssothecium circinans]